MLGFINLNKPPGITSRDAVNVVQKLVKPAKVGHCGTLDPLARGVLVVCVGPATRLTTFVQEAAKTYVGSFRLGVVSDTEDVQGDVGPLDNAPVIERAAIERVLPEFLGKIAQVPPAFSALKVNGKRAYELARRGQELNLKPRFIEIHSLQLTDFNYPNFELTVQCGSGTYIRSLGRDIAQAVGSGAIMTDLVRTAIGGFSISDSLDPNHLEPENIQHALRPVDQAVSQLPTLVLNDVQAASLINAVPIRPLTPQESDQVVAKNSLGQVVAIMQRRNDGSYSPKINFAGYWQKFSDA